MEKQLSSDFKDMHSDRRANPYGSNGQPWALRSMSKCIYGSNRQTLKVLHNYTLYKSIELQTVKIHPTVSDICILVDGQAHMGQMDNHEQDHMGQMTIVVHNYKSKQFHRTSNGENPPSSFMGVHSGPWASPFGPNGQVTITLHNYMSWQFQKRTSNAGNRYSGLRNMHVTMSELHWYQIWRFFAHGQAHITPV